MKEIGGYFEIEYANICLGIHPSAIKLNTARNCLEYILLANKYSKVYVPFYTCDVVLEPLNKHNINYTFYHINENLEPVYLPELNESEAFLYTNYFGLKNNYINSLQKLIGNLIIDNSQALFAPYTIGVDSFCSLRKFVGTPDGAFLFCKKTIDIDFNAAISFNRVSHLYKRKDINAADGFLDFKKNDDALSGLPILAISLSTNHFVSTYDFEKNRLIRERNFLYLHTKLNNLNRFKLDLSSFHGPLCYPLLLTNTGLKENFIKNKVYIPTYWPNVKEWIKGKDCFEKTLVDSLICLPIDQRYGIEDMNVILDLMKITNE